MNTDQQKERAVALIKQIDDCKKELQQIATNVHPEKAQQGWKKVLREELNICI